MTFYCYYYYYSQQRAFSKIWLSDTSSNNFAHCLLRSAGSRPQEMPQRCGLESGPAGLAFTDASHWSRAPEIWAVWRTFNSNLSEINILSRDSCEDSFLPTPQWWARDFTMIGAAIHSWISLYSWKDTEEIQGLRQVAGSSTFVKLYYSQRSIDASKQSTEGVFVWLWQNSCASCLWESQSEPPKRCFFQLFDHAWCDLWENSLLCLSLWTSGLCNELGDHIYQIQACLQSSRFIHLFMQAFNKCLLSPTYAADFPLTIKLMTWLRPRGIHRFMLLGIHVAGGQEKLSKGETWVRFWRTRASWPERWGQRKGTQAGWPQAAGYTASRELLWQRTSQEGIWPREALFWEPPTPGTVLRLPLTQMAKGGKTETDLGNPRDPTGESGLCPDPGQQGAVQGSLRK